MKVFKKESEKAELRHIRIHDLQHTTASLILQDGASILYVKEQLGHHSAAFTFDVYEHLLPGGNKEAVDRLDNITENATKRTP